MNGTRTTPRRRRTRGTVLLSLALAFCLAAGMSLSGCGKTATLEGPWHNEEFGQLLRFHDDGTVVVRTPYGDSEATWLYDKDKNQGVITLNGEAIGFTLDGDTLTLTWGDTQTTFVAGDMEVVPAIAEATPVSTPSPAATPTASAAPTATPVPTATPKPSATASASSGSSSPSFSLGPFPSLSFAPIATPKPNISLIPQVSGIIIPGDILGNLWDSVTGTWVYTKDDSYSLVFDGNGGVTIMSGGMGVGCNYTYDKTTHTGMITIMFEKYDFSVSGDILTLEDGSTYQRQS